MARRLRQDRSRSWLTAWVLAVAVAASPAFARLSDGRRPPEATNPVWHESAPEEIVRGLQTAHRGIERALEAGDLAGIHQGETAIDKALHALENHTQSVPESRRERANELLHQCFEIVDALHEAAEAEDVGALEQLVRELGTLFAKMQTLFHSASVVGGQASLRVYQTFNQS